MPRADFHAVFDGSMAYADAVRSLTHADAVELTGEVFDDLDRALADASDADVVAIPHDQSAVDAGEQGWNVAHIVAHVTAGLEEAAAQAQTLARGVPVEGRSRYETPWETLTTADAVRARVAESRRMTTALLGAWPDAPDLALTMELVPQFGPMNAIGRNLLGIMHAAMHPDQLQEALRQARA